MAGVGREETVGKRAGLRCAAGFVDTFGHDRQSCRLNPTCPGDVRPAGRCDVNANDNAGIHAAYGCGGFTRESSGGRQFGAKSRNHQCALQCCASGRNCSVNGRRGEFACGCYSRGWTSVSARGQSAGIRTRYSSTHERQAQ
jgi:hypothetical protein